MFIIILLFILVDIFILGFSHPHAVQVSVSWHERSVVQSLLSLETGDPLPTLFQSLCNSFTAQFWGQRGCFLCSETPWCCKAKACSAALAVLSLQCCFVLCILKTNPKNPCERPFRACLHSPCAHLCLVGRVALLSHNASSPCPVTFSTQSLKNFLLLVPHSWKQLF